MNTHLVLRWVFQTAGQWINIPSREYLRGPWRILPALPVSSLCTCQDCTVGLICCLPWPHLVGKASLYLLSLFPFHTVTPLFLYLRSVPTGNQVLGSGLRSSFRPRLLFFFLLFQSLELCLSSSAREKRKRMREGLAHESKGLDIREKGRGIAKGHREGDSAVGCHGYWKAAD